MDKLKHCPFCGGIIRITERSESTITIYTKAECMGCRMVFEYDQDFKFIKSKGFNTRKQVQINDSFETTFNRRAEDGK